MILHKPKNKKEKLLTRKIQNKWLFEYFAELSSGMLGYGVPYTHWLAFRKGWQLSGKTYNEYIKVPVDNPE